ncbi:MAG: quinate 5-dehydrogenase [Bacillota bacterium]
MKKVVSVSLGSSKRDHRVNKEFLGEMFEISRIGTDGNLEKAIEMLRDLDGQVDAIGLGGIDLYLSVGKERYAIKDALRLMEAVKQTPVVDGSGLKDTLEREVVKYLHQQGLLRSGQKVLMVSGADRFGMAEALVKDVGCDLVFGDLMFAMGMDYPIRTIAELEEIARKFLPEVVKMSFTTLYPSGNEQEEVSPNVARFASYYQEAEVIAGDFHYIRRYLPAELPGKLILTNTTTKEDVELLRQRGIRCLVTTTPEFEGRSFGTNVMEAVFITLIGKKWENVTPEDYLSLLRQLNYKPPIRELNRD